MAYWQNIALAANSFGWRGELVFKFERRVEKADDVGWMVDVYWDKPSPPHLVTETQLVLPDKISQGRKTVYFLFEQATVCCLAFCGCALLSFCGLCLRTEKWKFNWYRICGGLCASSWRESGRCEEP